MKYLDDLLVVAGGGLMVYATSLISTVAAFYAAGVLLVALGVLLGAAQKRGVQ